LPNQLEWLAHWVRVEFFDGPPRGDDETQTLHTRSTKIEANLKGRRIPYSFRFRSGIAAARRKTAEQGRHPGGGSAPYGYEVVRKIDVMSGRRPFAQLGSYIVLEEEARWVRVIFEQYLHTGSAANVIKRLLGNKVPPPGGGKTWYRDIVLHILRNTAYIGSAPYGRTAMLTSFELEPDGSRPANIRKQQERLSREEWETIPCPPIVSDEVFHAAQVLLRDLSRGPARVVSTARRPILDGYLFCGGCGARMVSGTYPHTRQRQGGEYYACTTCPPATRDERSPHPEWSAYPARYVLPLASEALSSLLPEPDRALVLEYLFSQFWNVEAYKRRRLFLLAQLRFIFHHTPCRVEIEFPLRDEFPKAPDGLIAALVENARLEAESAAYMGLMKLGAKR
jgi:hypothetical protein